MESYKKNETPTLDQKHHALVELDREYGVDKCETFSTWTIYDRRNHPGKLKRGRKVETFVGADSKPTITHDDNARYSPVSLAQATIMAEDSCNDFAEWLYSATDSDGKLVGFLIVTDADGKTLSPGQQGWYTFTRYCGWRRNVWRKVTSTIRHDTTPLSDHTLQNQKKRSVEKYGKHLDTYCADFHGMPVAKLSQSFILDDDDFTDTQQAQTLFYTREKETVISRTGIPCQAGWMITRVDSLRDDNRITMEDIQADHELAAIGRVRMGA